MPKRVTAWACEFGCGHKVQTKREKILIHENTCFKRPANRSCIICGNFLPSEFYEDTGPEPAGCIVDALDKPNKKNPNGLRRDCPKWKAK